MSKAIDDIPKRISKSNRRFHEFLVLIFLHGISQLLKIQIVDNCCVFEKITHNLQFPVKSFKINDKYVIAQKGFNVAYFFRTLKSPKITPFTQH